MFMSENPIKTDLSLQYGARSRNVGLSILFISEFEERGVRKVTTAPYGGVGGQTVRMDQCGPTVALPMGIKSTYGACIRVMDPTRPAPG